LLSTVGRHGEALKVLKSALRIKPGDTELIYNMGITQYASGKFEDALNDFLTCEKLRPDDGEVLYITAVIYMKTGRPKESMLYLEKAVLKDPAYGARASKENVFQKYIGLSEYAGLFTVS
jgi:tetratricopeptide (TPR) repeat protein